MLEGRKAEYETEIETAGGNKLRTRSFIVAVINAMLELPAGTVFTRVEATGNAPAHCWAEIHGVRVVLPEGEKPWAGRKAVTLELRVNSVEPANVTRECWRNYKITLDNVTPVAKGVLVDGEIGIRAEENQKVTSLRDGRFIHRGSRIEFPFTHAVENPMQTRQPERFNDALKALGNRQ